jgi:hypothetical protein
MSWQALFGIGTFLLLTGACCTVWGILAGLVAVIRLLLRR